MLPVRVLRRGREEGVPEEVGLRAGALTATFVEGGLRGVRLGGREVLRRVYVAVRDRDWGTIGATLSDVTIERGADTFRVVFLAEHREGAIDFAWRGGIVGEADGTITFTTAGEARSTFLRNRIGFCVLHPPRECAGARCVVEHDDGGRTEGTFPTLIAPAQPFVELRAIAHEVAPGVWAEVRFTGDIFEMEDQRNWTDDSYKTYCTPLRLPFPAEVVAGTRVAQAVTLRLRGTGHRGVSSGEGGLTLPPEREAGTDPCQADARLGKGPWRDVPERPLVTPDAAADDAFAPLTIAVGAGAGGPLPRLGLGVANHGATLTPGEVARLRALGLAHLRVDLALSGPGWRAALRRAASEAGALGVALEVAIVLSSRAEDELAALAAAVSEEPVAVARWLVFGRDEKVTGGRLVAVARQWLAGIAPGAAFGGGTDAYFTELNRARPDLAGLDLLAYSINPQVHAFDDASLIETLGAQGATVASARAFAGGLPLAITPLTLRPRANPDATGAGAHDISPGDSSAATELPAAVDVRQMSLLGAAWTVGSLAALAASGVASATYYETTGPRGTMALAAESPWPAFRAIPGGVYPLHHVLADVGKFAGGATLPVTVGAGGGAAALAIRQGGRRLVLVANLRPESRRVALHLGPGVERATVRVLDETNAEEAMRAPELFRAGPGRETEMSGGIAMLSLLPYAVARVVVMSDE